MKIQLKVLKLWLLSVSFMAWSMGSNAAELSLASGPLFLGTSVDANVFFELDDSGSMDWETLTEEYDYYSNYWDDYDEPKITTGRWRSYSNGSRYDFVYIFHENDSLYDGLYGYSNAEENSEALKRDWRALSSAFNLTYYDPEVTYVPWEGLSNANFSAARSDPQLGSDGYNNLRDLSGFVFNIWEDDHGYSGVRPDGPSDATDIPNGIVDLWDSRLAYSIWGSSWQTDSFDTLPAAGMSALGTVCSYSSVQGWVSPGWVPPYSDCFGTVSNYSSYTSSDVNPWGRNLAQEQLNIANWYQYYRKRSYVAKAAISAVITNSPDFRYGLSVINNYNSLFVEVPSAATTSYSSANTNLLSSLYNFDWPALGTPLRKGLERAGKYYDNALSGKVNPIISECQQNFSILLTDGYWNGNSPSSSIGDEDGDGNSEISVADVAKYYYDKDLSSLPNNVITSARDNNSQQHMVTFSVAFGVQGDLIDTDNDGVPNPVLDESDNWGYPDKNTANAAKIDDLWHAAFNSKGQFIAAQTPAEVVSSLNDALSRITDRIGSSASVATNSGSLQAGSHLFQARFDSARWSGDLIAFALNSDGTIDPSPSWQASQVLDSKNYDTGRSIFTYNPAADTDLMTPGAEGAGVAFRFPVDYTSPDIATEFNGSQLAALMSSAPYSSPANATEITENQTYGINLINYLRGDRTYEGAGTTYGFRNRDTALGDIIDSAPQYVGAPRARYDDDMEAKSYLDFRNAYASRTTMLYVGGNDGMLHAFNEADGAEKFAFIPSAVFSNLSELADPFYIHRYFANGSAVVVDAYLDETINPVDATTGIWRSILVGVLGGGGQSIYALDVTDPSTFSEAGATSTVLWEFSDDDLGYTYGDPSIANLGKDVANGESGQWTVVFGNGYNNTKADGSASGNGHAWLYIVDIDNGDLIKKIDTGVGSTSTPNGLSSPTLIDIDGDFVVDFIYAGDLLGNMWKFDVSSSDVNDWDVAFMESGNPKPLFTTFNNQPITTRPQVTGHPDNYGGYMVFFGTGKYLEQNDNDPIGANTQSLYGIWDREDGATIAASDLQRQYITQQFSLDFDTNEDTIIDFSKTVRTVSDYAIDFASKRGWYMELKALTIDGSANTANFGEKQVSNILIRNGRVIFTTLIPPQNICDHGGASYIMEVDYRNGGKLDYAVFDLNGDGVFDSQDETVTGIASELGITPTVSILSKDSTGSELIYYNGSNSGSGGSGTGTNLINGNGGPQTLGRQSWRQLK